jgi:hypothetical protein
MKKLCRFAGPLLLVSALFWELWLVLVWEGGYAPQLHSYEPSFLFRCLEWLFRGPEMGSDGSFFLVLIMALMFMGLVTWLLAVERKNDADPRRQELPHVFDRKPPTDN